MSEEDKKPAEDITPKVEEKKDADGQSVCNNMSWDTCSMSYRGGTRIPCGNMSRSTCAAFSY